MLKVWRSFNSKFQAVNMLGNTAGEGSNPANFGRK